MQELSGVSEASPDRALARFRLIQPYLEQRRSLQLVASDADLSFRTAQRWVSQYRKLGLAALVRKERGDRGARKSYRRRDVSQEEALLARYRSWFGAIMLGAFVIFPAAGYQIARRGIRPVEDMATTARHISSTNLRERILTAGYPVELASLADTFNEMLDRLEESFERIARFSADIAHDLRTPVNNIRGEAEVALARARTVDEYRDRLESCLEETVRLSDLIGALLFLARAESPLAHPHRVPVDVGELLAGVREYYDASAVEAGISLTTASIVEPIFAKLDRTLIQRAVGNLIANAVAHTPPGGSVTLRANADATTIRIDVSDTGEGIPQDALPKVFERFYRVDKSRSQASGGTGLGLSIVQSIMALHSGRVEIASKLGHGTRVTLYIPAA
jgi:two-component system heavy metal sensor histidine kinase CusS